MLQVPPGETVGRRTLLREASSLRMAAIAIHAVLHRVRQGTGARLLPRQQGPEKRK